MDIFLYYLASFVAVTVVITFHEFAHAFVANKCGDPTAKFQGRMTLNPAKHFDLLGILAFALVGFGWAKPVPVNPYNFKNRKWGSFWTSAAGVLVNYLMAFFFYPLLLLVIIYFVPAFQQYYAAGFVRLIFEFLFIYSLSFCVFNLLPFYPLDGFNMLDALNDRKGKALTFLRQYGYYILLGLMMISIMANRIPILGYIDILAYFRAFATNILGKPISLFWDWIFNLIIV